MRKPLAGLLVVEGGGAAASFLGRMLGDLGAAVGAVPPPSEAHARFDAYSAYEATFAINKAPLNLARLDDAVAAADVVIYEPGEAGASWPITRWRERFPHLIVVVISAFGVDGPFSDRPSSDLVNMAMSGYLALTGPAGGRPVKPTIPFLSARHAANYALAALFIALRRRRLTGQGSFVDVAMRDTQTWKLAAVYQRWEVERVVPIRVGSAYSLGDASRLLPTVFQCRDGCIVWVPLVGRSARGTIKLIEWMDRENHASEWLTRVDWETFELESQSDIDEFVNPFSAFFRTKTQTELLEAALRDGFLLAPVLSVAEVLDDPQLAARGAWSTAIVAGAPVKLARSPIRMQRIDWGPPGPARRDVEADL